MYLVTVIVVEAPGNSIIIYMTTPNFFLAFFFSLLKLKWGVPNVYANFHYFKKNPWEEQKIKFKRQD